MIRVFPASHDEYGRARIAVIYPETDAFVICFSISDPESFKNARDKWLPEIRQHCSDAPFILCGTKGDLRGHQETIAALEERGASIVPREQAEALSINENCGKYFEVSAKHDMKGLQILLSEMVSSAVSSWAKRNPGSGRGSNKCSLM